MMSDRKTGRYLFGWDIYLGHGKDRLRAGSSMAMTYLVRVLDRSGKVRNVPRDATISDISASKNRRGRFGISRILDNYGAAAGTVIAIFTLSFAGI
jgi:hypothetical protein